MSRFFMVHCVYEQKVTYELSIGAEIGELE